MRLMSPAVVTLCGLLIQSALGILLQKCDQALPNDDGRVRSVTQMQRARQGVVRGHDNAGEMWQDIHWLDVSARAFRRCPSPFLSWDYIN